GPSWNAESDSGNRIVVPYLRGEGVRRLDALILTHADDDHAGGAASVAKSRAPALLVTPLPADDERRLLAPESRDCVAGTRWSWDGVAFEVLHPDAGALRDRRRENDRSCVLRVATAGGAMLLAADIERQAERELVSRRGAGLRSEALLVPHHGSRSSSTPAFVAAVSPKIALVSAGWRNRFRQPSPEVLARYRETGAVILRTDFDGALRVRLPGSAAEAASAEPLLPRVRYWSERRPGGSFRDDRGPSAFAGEAHD
ncbi:MAG: MBL fold metallo-hydrolase, partial [Burkholderiales bacterium]|nr:MBL fold metallo-hydrolase [Burkholderiales bacterium]